MECKTVLYDTVRYGTASSLGCDLDRYDMVRYDTLSAVRYGTVSMMQCVRNV